jgi:tRNA modification GTPase
MSAMFSIDETIVALASPAGAGPRGIVRLSGSATRELLTGFFQPADEASWNAARGPRRHAGHLVWAECRVPIPVDVQFWPGSRGYTRQPLAELHLAGSPPLLEAVLVEFLRRGARAARPGEFTLRAFLSGQLDLMQAEAVLGVIDARDPRELQTALRQLAGRVSSELVAMRADLIDLLADLEAGLDFVEEDIEFVSRDNLRSRVARMAETLQILRDRAAGHWQSRPIPRIVLAGLPNAGKSTLFNRLCGQSTAITSPEPGTTRDVLLAEWQVGNRRYELMDTAGEEDARDALTTRMQQLRDTALAEADLVVWCRPVDLGEEDDHRDEQARVTAEAKAARMVIVSTKGDLGSPAASGSLIVAAEAGTGVNELARAVEEALSRDAVADRQWLGSTAARCAASLDHAILALRQAVALADAHGGEELLAVEIREAMDHLGEIVGAVYTDDLLDRIFSKFCIGK